MANSRLPGPLGVLLHTPWIDSSNMCFIASPQLGTVGVNPSKLPRLLNGSPSSLPHIAPQIEEDTKVITGLLFPLSVSATADYHSGARRFGARRSGGRRHAGIDLFAPQGTQIRAMAAGKVINVYEFYAQTWAIEIDHGSFIARYGEVDGHEDNLLVDPGDPVERGQQIAVVGKLVGINVDSNMLHLELYASTARSALTVKGNPPYQRRSDLIDPTKSIDMAVFK